MRTITLAQRNRQKAAHRNYHLKIETQNGDTVPLWKELTNLGNTDWVDTWSVEGNIDQSVAQATVTLMRETEDFSLAPLMGGSTLNRKTDNTYSPILKAGRRLRITIAITEHDVAPIAGDWIEIFIGKIDKVNWGQDPVTVECRDLGAYIQKRWIEQKITYYEGVFANLKTHLQLLLDTWMTTPVTIQGVDPLVNIDGYTQDQDSLLEATRVLTALIGWDLRYKYNAGVSELTLYEVLRDKVIADDTVGPDEYYDVTNISISDVDIRNRGRLLYIGPFGGPGEAFYEDAPSIAEYDVQYMQIGPEEAKTIRNGTDALRAITAIIKDLRDPGAEHDILCSLLWHVELGDLYTFQANGVHYDSDQKFAIYGYRHEGAEGDMTTTLTTRGKPAGQYKQWMRRYRDNGGQREELKIDIKVTSGDTSFIEYTVISNIDAQLLYAFGDDPFVTPVPVDGIIQVLRATNDSGDRLLRIQGTTPNGFQVVETVIVDYDTSPEVHITAEYIPLFEGNVQVGWRVKGNCDDDCRAVVISSPNMTIAAYSPAGTSPGAGVVWMDTRNTKTWSVDLLQGAGAMAVVTITPREFYNTAAGGLGGQPAVISLSRAPITSHQVRDISSTSREITLSVVPITATIKYRVNAGAWQERAGGTTTFTEDVEAAAAIIEYLSYTASGTSEELKRLVVDQNDQPGFALTPSLVEAAQNKLQLTVSFDEDVVMWRMWARRGLWPSIEQIDPAIWAPLEEYKRYDGGVERATVEWFAGGASVNWYVVVRGYDDSGNFVQWNGFVTLSAGAPPAVGSLSGQAANRVVHIGVDYHDITWSHNQTVQDVSHTVTIRENGVQLVAGRDARLEHDGGAVVALIGGYHHTKVFANPGDPGAEYLTSNYEIELRRVSDGGLVATYATSVAGWFAPGGGGSAPPTEVPTTLAADGQVLQAQGTWVNTSPTWRIRIEWYNTSGPLVGSAELDKATALHIQTGLAAGNTYKFRLQYFNSYGAGPWSAYSANSDPVLPEGDPPTEIPTGMTAQGRSGYEARGVWTNTSNAHGIQLEWFLNGAGYNTELADPGSTSTPYAVWTLGDLVKFRIRYYNDVGNGPWSGFSSQILIHA